VPRVLLLALLSCAALAAPAAASVSSPSTWDVPQQRAAMRAGLLDRLSDGRFHGERPLTGGRLAGALSALGTRLAAPVILTPPAASPVTVARFDALLVAQLGLADVAAAVETEAARAGLRPPSYFGTEVVARLLGLRYNHPFPAGEAIELDPTDVITRAEAAWSLATILHFAGWEVPSVREQLASFVLPGYTSAQRSALRIAVSKIGMPYIWGGETDQASYGQVHGGYDCSGFVWRVFKLTGLVSSIRGRTAAQMAGEIPTSARIAWNDLQPGDLMFFGSAHFRSRATESDIVHTGIVLGGGWLINASSQGVFVQPMEGWRHQEFAWGRRVL